jgi:hypothetical protein
VDKKALRAIMTSPPFLARFVSFNKNPSPEWFCICSATRYRGSHSLFFLYVPHSVIAHSCLLDIIFEKLPQTMMLSRQKMARYVSTTQSFQPKLRVLNLVKRLI